MDQLVRTKLWTHQIEDVEKLQEEPQALIANQMGTGKSLLAVERDLRFREDDYKGPTLVVAPLVTHDTWLSTFHRETDLSVTCIDRKRRDKFLATDADVYIMHYEALRLMPWLASERFGHIIVDECHKIKNRKAAATKAIKKVKAPYLSDMSGSPVTDRPQDIWSILNHLKPRNYKGYWNFFREYVNYETIESWEGRKRKTYDVVLGPAEAWTTKGLPAIQPFFVRRLSEDCMDLPPRVQYTIKVDLSPQQRRIYNEMRDDMLTWLRNMSGEEEALAAPAIIAKLIRLQQITCGTPMFNEVGNIKLVDPSTKADAVMALLDTYEDEQFVVFSQFKGPLRILSDRFRQRKITYGTFTGDDNSHARERSKREFISGDSRVFLSTINTGGTGVDGLQLASNNAIFIDWHWSPAVNDQAIFRLHRGGQKRSVNIFSIMAKDTIDFSRMATIEMKAEWVRKMLGDD